MRYLAGCRCRRCRRGNAEYEARLNLNRKLYGPNDLVSSDRVRDHVNYLRTFGMGPKTIAKHARVAKTSLREILYDGRQHVRRRNETRILAVQPSLDTLPRNVNIPAGETVTKIEQMIRWGYPKSLINRDALGHNWPGLQIHKYKSPNTTVRTAVNIRNFYALVITMRRVWQERRGSIPQRHYVYWNIRRGRKPTVPTIRRLELRPFAVTYDYNYIWPKELREVSNLTWKLRRLHRQKSKEAHGK
jgi:hypothetical protein